MTEPVKTMEDAPHLGDPLPTPDPAPGCGRCEQLAVQRTAARAEGDWTRVTDCNIEMRRCSHTRPGGAR
ncbi:hypothetical protein GCM10010294_70880 [Streptomyces griseoloalbus]|uniref:hypothetical protein n=1 Tax=Streptomyces griseoloalbus TaxID=67303 RepID=UPI00199F06D8|nr:hypothetical protein GCM10010294_70880 [Streptomyces griseoloalbus]